MLDQMREQDAEPAIWLYRTTEHRRSKFGGLPNLPRSISWPRRKFTADQLEEEVTERTGASENSARFLAKGACATLNAFTGHARPPMHFLGQIDLSELPVLPLEKDGPTLPTQGFLFFFANLAIDAEDDPYLNYHWMEDGEDYGSDTRVIYSRTAGPQRPPPKQLHSLGTGNSDDYAQDDPIWRGVFPAHSIAAKRVLTGGQCPVPDAYLQGQKSEMILRQRDWVSQQFDVEIPSTSLEWQEWSRFPVALQVAPGRSNDAPPVAHDLHLVSHQMFGAAPTVQSEHGSTREAQSLSGDQGIPLMTFDTDWGVHREFMFCDYGILQFWIKPRDLANRRFDRCYATTEGG